jgi:Fic family protein
MACLDPFERFLHDEPSPMPILLKAGLAHVQFETIHPFLDGNGRLGRLLITLLLLSEQALKEPLLYLSLYFKTRRAEYYDRLQQVRLSGDWEGWLRFFLQGVYETAQQSVETARQLLALFESDRQRIRGLGRIAGSCLQVHELLTRQPIQSIAQATGRLGINRTTIANCFRGLQALGIAREITGNRRNRLFVYDRYVALLSEGTEPIR